MLPHKTVENLVEITAVGRAIACQIRAHSVLHHDGARGAAGFRERRAGRGKLRARTVRTTSRRDERNIILSDMHVVIADQLSSSAIEILRTVPGFTVDARPQRPAAELAKDLADARRLDRSQRHPGRREAHRRRAPASGDRPRRHRRGQRRRRRRHRSRHRRHECAWREQRQRGRTRLGADAGAVALGRRCRCGDEARRVGQEAAHRRGAARQDARRRRARPNRPGSDQPGARLRHARAGARPVHLGAGRRNDGRRARAARRSLRALGLHHPAHSGDRGDQESVRRGADCGVQARRPRSSIPRAAS